MLGLVGPFHSGSALHADILFRALQELQRRSWSLPVRQVMKRLGTLIVALLFQPFGADAASCATVPLCERLRAGTVAFIGKATSRSWVGRHAVKVTFQVLEPIWGITGESTFNVTLLGGVAIPVEQQFVLAVPGLRGTFYDNYCEPTLISRPEDQEAREFRSYVSERKPARIPIEIVSGTHVRLNPPVQLFRDGS